MSEIFYIDLPPTAVTGEVDLVEIVPADDRAVELIGLYLAQTTDVGEAQEEQLEIEAIRGYTTSGSGGSTSTVRPAKRNGGSSGFGAPEIFNTTVATVGTTHILLHDGWQVRQPYAWREIQREESPEATQADTSMVIRLSAPADSITVFGCAVVREG